MVSIVYSGALRQGATGTKLIETNIACFARGRKTNFQLARNFGKKHKRTDRYLDNITKRSPSVRTGKRMEALTGDVHKKTVVDAESHGGQSAI